MITSQWKISVINERKKVIEEKKNFFFCMCFLCTIYFTQLYARDNNSWHLSTVLNSINNKHTRWDIIYVYKNLIIIETPRKKNWLCIYIYIYIYVYSVHLGDHLDNFIYAYFALFFAYTLIVRRSCLSMKQVFHYLQ